MAESDINFADQEKMLAQIHKATKRRMELKAHRDGKVEKAAIKRIDKATMELTEVIVPLLQKWGSEAMSFALQKVGFSLSLLHGNPYANLRIVATAQLEACEEYDEAKRKGFKMNTLKGTQPQEEPEETTTEETEDEKENQDDP